MAILTVDALVVEYRTPRGALRAVDGASFEVPDGAVVGLVGEVGLRQDDLGPGDHRRDVFKRADRSGAHRLQGP